MLTLILLFLISSVLSSSREIRILNVLKFLLDSSVLMIWKLLLEFLSEFRSSLVALTIGCNSLTYHFLFSGSIIIGLVLNKTVSKKKEGTFEG